MKYQLFRSFQRQQLRAVAQMQCSEFPNHLRLQRPELHPNQRLSHQVANQRLCHQIAQLPNRRFRHYRQHWRGSPDRDRRACNQHGNRVGQPANIGITTGSPRTAKNGKSNPVGKTPTGSTTSRRTLLGGIPLGDRSPIQRAKQFIPSNQCTLHHLLRQYLLCQHRFQEALRRHHST